MKAVSLNSSSNLHRISYRDALLKGYYCIELPNDVHMKVLYDWLVSHKVYTFALTGINNNRCIAIEDKEVAILLKFLWA